MDARLKSGRPMHERFSVVAAVAVPPPIAGQSVAGSMLLRALAAEQIPLKVINLGRAVSGISTSAQKLERTGAALRFVVELCRARQRLGTPTVFYLQLGRSRGGLMRDFPLLQLARWLKMPAVIHLHGLGLQGSLNSLPGPVRRRIGVLLREVARAIVLSPRLLSDVEGIVPRHSTVVVPNGVEHCTVEAATRERARAQGVFTCLYLANLSPAKGYDTVLEVARLSQRQKLEFRFVIAGEPGAGGIELPDSFATRNKLGNIVWLGPVEAELKHRTLASADVLLLPSESEGQPISILEAMHFGAVAVASDVGGIPDLLRDGVTGFLVPPGDAGAILAVLVKLSRNRHKLNAIRRAAAAEAKAKYTEELHAQQMVEVLRDVAREHFGARS